MTRAWHSQFKRASKADRTNRDGVTFDSKSEMKRYEYLRQLVLAKQVRGLRRQVEYPLIINEKQIGKYTADFVYEMKAPARDDQPEIWIEVVEEHKGHFDKASKFRIAVFEALYGVKVLITGDAARG